MSAAVTRATAQGQLDSPASTGQAARGQLPGTDSRAASGMTTLMGAACDGRVDIAQLLIDCGAAVNARRRDGFTALALAAFFGHDDVVQLLLERGADVEATTRFGTSAEMWAASRGFLRTSDVLRQARVKKAQAPVPLTLVHQEDLCSSHRREDGDGKEVELEVPSDEGCETTLESTKVPAPLVAEIEANSPTLDPIVGVNTGQALSHDEPRTKSKAVKALPDIIDLPPITPPAFHPGSVFLSRVNSSGKTLAALGLAIFIVCGFVAFMISRTLTGGSEESIKTTEFSGKSNETLAQPEQRTSEEIGTSNTSPSAPVDPATSRDANAIKTNSSEQNGTESDRKLESVEAPEKASSTNVTFRNENSDSFSNRPGLAVAPTLLRASAPNRKRKPILVTATSKESPAPDEEAKPAALSVEATRSRTTTSPPERPTETPSRQAAPLGVTSGKPKSKVIQWP